MLDYADLIKSIIGDIDAALELIDEQNKEMELLDSLLSQQ